MKLKHVLIALALVLTPFIAKADSLSLDVGGGLTLIVPLDHVSAVSLWDFKSKTGLGGGETPIATYKKFTLSGGAVTSVAGQGSPFFRIFLDLPNPVGNFAQIETLKPGLFAGRDFRNNAYFFGIGASLALW